MTNMRILEVIKNEKTGVLSVFLDGENFGVFDDVDDDKYSYFAKKEDRLTGDDYIAIGEALNKINESKN
ncbi:MAG: hypothetical protein ACRBCS_16085 [Cellvibrionaceae bacterium]